MTGSLRGDPRKAARCLVTGHLWVAARTAVGGVIILCSRCRELIAGRLDDEPFGGEPADRRATAYGDATAARHVLRLLEAHAVGDGELARAVSLLMRGRPEQSLHAMTSVATGLLGQAAAMLDVPPEVVARRLLDDVELRLIAEGGDDAAE